VHELWHKKFGSSTSGGNPSEAADQGSALTSSDSEARQPRSAASLVGTAHRHEIALKSGQPLCYACRQSAATVPLTPGIDLAAGNPFFGNSPFISAAGCDSADFQICAA
jgi:hypothetical protein